jgi:hypothetical protein
VGGGDEFSANGKQCLLSTRTATDAIQWVADNWLKQVRMASARASSSGVMRVAASPSWRETMAL